MLFQCFSEVEIVGLYPVCDTRAGPNTGGIQAILLISCCFHFWVTLWPLPSGGLSNSKSRLHYWTGHSEWLLLTSCCSSPTPFMWVCVLLGFACVYVDVYLCIGLCACACVRDPNWLVSNKKMKSIVEFHPPPANYFLLLLHLHFLEPLGALPRCNQLPDKHQQHLSCGQKCWVAITSQQTT